MISGCISGGLVGVAWIIGFIIYFFKRGRRERRARALGFQGHREMLDPPKKPVEFIIPPDPAIVESGMIPGERIYDDPKWKEDSPKHAKTFPFSQFDSSTSKVSTVGEQSPPPLPHWSSAPSRIVYVSNTGGPSISRSTTKSSGESMQLTPLSSRKSAE
ncbi:hypothetical protein EIP86_004990 [Pleurotus ostreatoroseus]|nr:hypothetical protein EIP86_004990 [Pleurotus ostreatoroseus]